MSVNDDVNDIIDKIMSTDIDGCITGSCLLDDDFDLWDSVPDVDMFVYSEAAMIHAICALDNAGLVPGGKDKNHKGEEVKRKWILETGVNRKSPVCTIMYQDTASKVAVNVTYKRNCNSLIEVLASFDMSIIMKGIDITTGYKLDLTETMGSDKRTAVPNKLKRHLYNHPSRFDVDRCLRQWNRVIKYYGRGYDTRPMAKFYLGLIDEVLEEGPLFGTENDVISFEQFKDGFIEMKETIDNWLKAHEDD